jgi:Ice-binding-like
MRFLKEGAVMLMRPLRSGGAALFAPAAIAALAGCSASSGTTPTDGGRLNDAGDASSDGANPDGGSATDTGTGGDTDDPGSVQPVSLGTAGNYVILAESGISTVPTSAVTGDMGISPAAASYITGFSLTADATNLFSTSTQVTGHVYAPAYAQPTPSNLTAAVGDMGLAFTDAAGRAAGVTELGAGNIGGMTLTAGVYEWSTGLLIPTSVTLDGSATDVWIFQVAQGLTVSSATSIILSGGAVPKNVFWQVSGAVDLGTTSHFEGVVLGMTSITLRTGASIDGRLLAQQAVNIDESAVVEPAP